MRFSFLLNQPQQTNGVSELLCSLIQLVNSELLSKSNLGFVNMGDLKIKKN